MAAIDQELAARPRTASPSATQYRIYSLIILIVILLAWETAPRLGLVNEIILPRFSRVVGALWTLVQQDFFLKHFSATLTEILIGFFLGTTIGLTLGITLAVWP